LLPQRASLKRASKAADLIFMYMYYIYADEISIVSAYFGLPQCTAFGPAGYSCLINRHKANKQCDHLSSLVFFYSWRPGAGVSDYTAFCWVLLAIYGGAFCIIRAAFAIIRSGSSRRCFLSFRYYTQWLEHYTWKSATVDGVSVDK
jgi:hypothetical protein